MNRIVWLLLFFVGMLMAFIPDGPPLQKEEITWYSINDLDSLKAIKDKKILLDIYSNTCAACRKMDGYTFKDRRIVKYINEHYYPIKFNGESKDTLIFKGETYFPGKRTHQLTLALNIQAYPTFMFFDKEGNVITKEAKFFSPNEMEVVLHYIEGDHFKNTSYLTYKNSYEY